MYQAVVKQRFSLSDIISFNSHKTLREILFSVPFRDGQTETERGPGTVPKSVGYQSRSE